MVNVEYALEFNVEEGFFFKTKKMYDFFFN
jgi:hypothetical protein